MRRLCIFAVVLLALCAPTVAAVFWRLKGEELAAMEAVQRAASAHQRVGYAGVAGWETGAKSRQKHDGWKKSESGTKSGSGTKSSRWHSKRRRKVDVQHDAKSGRTLYRWNRHPYVRAGPSTRASDPAGWCLDPAAVSRNYIASRDGIGFLLGRATRRLTLTPKHAGRPTVHLEVDADTELPLQVATFGHDGALYRKVAFQRVEIGPQEVTGEITSKRSSSRSSDRTLGLDALRNGAGFPVVLPDYLPAGFVVRECRLSDWMGGTARVSYTDGVTTFELRQSLVRTPAQMEAILVERFGERRAHMVLKKLLRMEWEALYRSEQRVPGELMVRRTRSSRHNTYRLRMDVGPRGDVDVTITARSDLDQEQVLAVIRSLRPVGQESNALSVVR
ncbi:MAG: sigma-E factor regulatory protein RseB domain-containing protein [Planctomycetota bacterium]